MFHSASVFFFFFHQVFSTNRTLKVGGNGVACVFWISFEFLNKVFSFFVVRRCRRFYREANLFVCLFVSYVLRMCVSFVGSLQDGGWVVFPWLTPHMQSSEVVAARQCT